MNDKEKKVIIRPGVKIGYVDAIEDKEFLDNCFVENVSFDRAIDMHSPECILLGRTGAGKSAAVYKIKSTQENCLEIDPKSLSLNYITNSNVIKFIHDNGVDLNVFFQLLWRHVLTIQLLNYRYKVENRDDFSELLDRLTSLVGGNQARKAAISYLTEWGTKFWEDTDVRIKELVERFEVQVTAGLDLPSLGVPANVDASYRLSGEQKTEVVKRLRKIVSDIQIRKLAQVIDFMAADIFNDDQKKYFVLIDGLDEDWVDDDIRYKLVRSLIETLKTFRKIRCVKIIVALRVDLLDRVFKHTQSSGFQREKFEDYIIRIEWSKKQILELVEKRISYVYKSKYTKQNIEFFDLFRKKYGKGVVTEDYLVHRTQFRPRDIIAFVNTIFLKAENGDNKFSWQAIDSAENDYSDKRKQALIDEWGDEYPYLGDCMSSLVGQNTRFKISELEMDDIEETILKIAALDSSKKYDDTLIAIAKELFNSVASAQVYDEFRRKLISVLYKVGAVGVKLRHASRVIYSYEQPQDLDEGALHDDTYVSISPMLWKTLRVARKRGFVD